MLHRMKAGQDNGLVLIDAIHEAVRESRYRSRMNLKLYNLHGFGIFSEQDKLFTDASECSEGLGQVMLCGSAGESTEISIRRQSKNHPFQSLSQSGAQLWPLAPAYLSSLR